MTVPSVLSMYGIVLGYLVNSHKKFDPDVWNEKITVTPILMTAFWSLAGNLINLIPNFRIKLVLQIKEKNCFLV